MLNHSFTSKTQLELLNSKKYILLILNIIKREETQFQKFLKRTSILKNIIAQFITAWEIFCDFF